MYFERRRDWEILATLSLHWNTEYDSWWTWIFAVHICVDEWAKEKILCFFLLIIFGTTQQTPFNPQNVGLTTINISIVNVVVCRSMYLLHLVALSPNHRSWAFGLSRIDARTMCIFFHLVCSLGGFLFVFVWLTSSLHRHTLLSYGSIVSSSFAFESAQSTLCVFTLYRWKYRKKIGTKIVSYHIKYWMYWNQTPTQNYFYFQSSHRIVSRWRA